MRRKKITAGQFRAVEEGMSCGEVVRLLGREGTLASRTDGSDGPVVASYYWWNDNRSYMEAAFEDDRLVYKHQSRLRQAGPREWSPLRLRRPGCEARSSGRDVAPAPPPVARHADAMTFFALALGSGGTALILIAVIFWGFGEIGDEGLVEGALLGFFLLWFLFFGVFNPMGWIVLIVLLVVAIPLLLFPALAGFGAWFVFLFSCTQMADTTEKRSVRWCMGLCALFYGVFAAVLLF